jgi:hypothetical protein
MHLVAILDSFAMVKVIGYLPERVSSGLRNDCFSGTITVQQPCTEVIVTQPLSAVDWGG